MTQTAMTPGHSHSLKIPALRPVSSRPVATDWKKSSLEFVRDAQVVSLKSLTDQTPVREEPKVEGMVFVITKYQIKTPVREGLNVEGMVRRVWPRLVQGGPVGFPDQNFQPKLIFN